MNYFSLKEPELLLFCCSRLHYKDVNYMLNVALETKNIQLFIKQY